jgi:hypothetical protein
MADKMPPLSKLPVPEGMEVVEEYAVFTLAIPADAIREQPIDEFYASLERSLARTRDQVIKLMKSTRGLLDQ